MIETQEIYTDNAVHKKKERRGRKPVVWILWICFSVSVLTLIIYLMDRDYSDETLFLLLNILWYSSFMVCVCAFYRLLEGIYYIIKRRKASRSLRLIPSMLFIIYGLCIIFFESLITAISRGNI